MPIFTNYARLPILLLLLLSCSVQPCSAQQQIATPADLLTGETLHYVIDFWLLHGTADAELCFSKTPQGYIAYFEAETRGLLRALTGARRETMESIMDYDPVRQRLRPRMFRETFQHNKMIFKRTVSFDYEQGFFTCTRIDPDGSTRATRAALPDAEFEDMLSLYYNFRMGYYGPLPGSGMLRVQAIMKEQPSFINIEFPPPGSKEHARGFSAALAMERDLTHAFSKRVLTKINPSNVLEKALVVDAYFFGDLEVKLSRISYY